MSLFLLSHSLPISSPTLSLYPHYSLYYYSHTKLKASVFPHFGIGQRLKIISMDKEREGFSWASSSACKAGGGDIAGELGGEDDDDDEDEGNVSEIEAEDDFKDTSSPSSVLPERWDVLGLGQAMEKGRK